MSFDSTFCVSDVITVFMALASVAAVLTTLYVYRKEREPRIAVFLESDTDNGTIELVVRNDGESAARNIRLPLFDWGMTQQSDLSIIKGSFITKGIPMLAPGCERRTILCTTRYAGNKLLDKEVLQHVDYERRTWRNSWTSCWDEFTLDYYSFAHTLYVASDEHQSRIAIQNMCKASKRQADALDTLAYCADELGGLVHRVNEGLDALSEQRAAKGVEECGSVTC